MDDLKHVMPGDPLAIPATAFNTMIDAARAFRARARGHGADAPAAGRDRLTPALEVFVRNDTGASLPAWSCVALGDPLISAVDAPLGVRRTPAFACHTPAAAAEPFAITAEPIADGKLGRAVVLGVVPADVNVTDESHGFAGPKAAQQVLEGGESGPAQILWKDGGTGTVRAVVLLDRRGGDSASPCGWVAGMRPDDCLTLSVLSAAGACSDIDTGQVLKLSWDGDSWASSDDFDYDGGSGPADFGVTADGLPKLTIGGVPGVVLGCHSDPNSIDFAFGGATLCDGTATPCGDNTFVVRVACTTEGDCCGADPLVVSATADPASGGAPLTVAFASTVSGGVGPYSYFWDFGDGSTSTEANPTHVYTAGGTYSAELTVADDCGVLSATATVTVVAGCPVCESGIQLGVSGSFVAPCSGRLMLAFNDIVGGFGNNVGSYAVTIDGTPYTVPAAASGGVPGPLVTSGATVTYSATGICEYGDTCAFDADGTLQPGSPGGCNHGTFPGSLCDGLVSFSLVGWVCCDE